jgi:hypothetical protein
MLKTALALATALFVLAAAPPSKAAPTAGLLAAKSTQNLVEPVYLRRHWGHRHYYRRAYWGHRHYYRPVYWRHRHYYRYWGPARRHCGWW